VNWAFVDDVQANNTAVVSLNQLEWLSGRTRRREPKFSRCRLLCHLL